MQHRTARGQHQLAQAGRLVTVLGHRPAAMRQAIKEGEDESTRTGTYIIWRTGEALREQGAAVELPSKATLTGCW
ncbi:hypothetical protein [Nonomuraea bangladeshensis]|uniref:hypothetical protein n=1 Tax=Nonomuraea bangladeshensis TaxID=404385 RepID=UPI003C2F9C88